MNGIISEIRKNISHFLKYFKQLIRVIIIMQIFRKNANARWTDNFVQ